MKRSQFTWVGGQAKKCMAAALALCMAFHCSACQKMQPFHLGDGMGRQDDTGNMGESVEKAEGDIGKPGDKLGNAGNEGNPGVTEGVFPVSYGKNLMEGITAQAVETERDSMGQDIQGIQNTAALSDFAVRLFRYSMAEDQVKGSNSNTLLSPMSVLYALAMAANGADGETLQQMEQVFGLSIEQLNHYLYAYRQSLPSAEKYKVSLANAIWFTEDGNFQASTSFLQKNADYYGADIYQTAFDGNTRQAINAWVKERTGGMIKEIIGQIPEEAIMYLVNAVSFDAEWQNIYEQAQIRTGEFTAASGEKQQAEYMHSQEHVYLEDEDAVGFLKYYADSKYAFAALLPKEGISLEEYAAALTGEKLQEILSAPGYTQVVASIPKFTAESSYVMNGILAEMGIKDAFHEIQADFSKMGVVPKDYNVSIGRVIHKAKMEVDERGTKAGAATAVEMRNTITSIQEKKYVTLDRPFLYMIIDCETNLPLFFGAVQAMS